MPSWELLLESIASLIPIKCRVSKTLKTCLVPEIDYWKREGGKPERKSSGRFRRNSYPEIYPLVGPKEDLSRMRYRQIEEVEMELAGLYVSELKEVSEDLLRHANDEEDEPR